MTETTEQRLIEQVAYYRARAPEYDAWGDRSGSYDRGDQNAGWHAERVRLAAAIEEFGPRGRVLEVAGGTGQWTEELVRHADDLTVLDAAPEAIARNRARLGGEAARVTFRQADIFSWEPEAQYDVVFFAFWLSHVPPERFEAFWDRISRCLAPEGRIFVIDNLDSERAARLDPEEPAGDGVSVVRQTSDGRTYRVWKILWRPETLAPALEPLGWRIQGFSTGTYFFWAEGRRA